MTTSTSLQINIQPERAELRLGEPVSIEVQIFNGSPVVDEFSVELLGPIYDPVDPEWVVSVPATLPLFPGQTGSVTLTLLVPAGSHLAAGAHRLGVRVGSTTDRQQAIVREIVLAVSSQPALYMRLEPENVVGGRTAELEVQLRNIGNSPLHIVLGADDPANALTFEFEHREIELSLDTERFIRLEVAGKRPLIGRSAQHTFSVAATITDLASEIGVEPVPFGEPARANGMFSQRPWVSGAIVSALAVLIPVLAILVAAFILRPATESPVLAGDLTFGVEGEVQEVHAREGNTVLTGDPLAKLDESLARLDLNARQVTLREAVVAREALETQLLIDQATASIPPAVAEQPDAAFLVALDEQLMAAQLDALDLSRSALTGLVDAFTAYCAGLAEPLPECPNPNYPLTADTVAALQQDASSLSASVVLDANDKYTQVTLTLQNLQSLRDNVEAQIAASGGEAPEDTEPVTPEELQLALAQQSAVEAEQANADLAKANQAVSEALVVCEEAIDAIGLTTLRAPFDVRITNAFVTRGAEVKADDVAFHIERTDGRPFELPTGQRRPAITDIPDDERCPTTIEDWHAYDEESAAAEGNGAAVEPDK